MLKLLIFIFNLRKKDLNKKIAKSEKTLEDAKLFIEKIQEKRKEIERENSDDSDRERSKPDLDLADVSEKNQKVSEKDAETKPASKEAIQIYNKLKDDAGREPAPRVISDSFFDIQVADKNLAPKASKYLPQSPSQDSDNTTTATSSYNPNLKRGISTNDISTRTRERRNLLNRFLLRDNKDNVEGTSATTENERTRKNLIKNLFTRR